MEGIRSLMKKLCRGLAAMCLALAVAGCEEDGISLKVVGYNHTDTYIHSFSVNGGGGAGVLAHGGGGKFVCCVVVPRKWQPELKATVRWMNDDDSWSEVTVDIPEYDPKLISFVNVHFLASGKIKVFVTGMGLGHPDYPLQGKEAEL